MTTFSPALSTVSTTLSHARHNHEYMVTPNTLTRDVDMWHKHTTQPPTIAVVHNNTMMTQQVGDADGAGMSADKIFHTAMVTYIVLICAIGIFGNCMGLTLIWTSHNLKRMASNYYLTALALGGNLFLICLLLLAIEWVFELPIYAMSTPGCKLFTFATHFADFICNWTIAMLSIDRAVILYRPVWWKTFTGRKVAARMVVSLTVTSLLFNGWILFAAGLRTRKFVNNSVQVCDVQEAYQTLYGTMIAVETLVAMVLPTALIATLNVAAIKQYRHCTHLAWRVRFQAADSATTDRQDLMNGEDKLGNGFIVNAQVDNGVLAYGDSKRSVTISSESAHRRFSLRPSDLHLTRILLTLTSLFVLLNSPQYVLRLFQTFYFVPTDRNDQPENLPSWYQNLHYASFIPYYMHYAVLFYLYIFWSPNMKKEISTTAMKLIECYCMKPVPDF